MRWLAMVGLLGLLAAGARAQAPLPLYTDNLVNGFQNWGWGRINLENTNPVHSGSCSISLTGTAWNVALSLGRSGFNTTPYGSLSLWAHGGTGGGQVLQVYATVNGTGQAATRLSALTANLWRPYVIPLAALGAANETNCSQFTFQLTSQGTTNPFYLDDLELTSKPGPALVHVSLNSTQAVRGVDARWFGLNTAVWDGDLDTAQTPSLLKESGTQVLRFPGGSLSDEYQWSINKVGTTPANTWTPATDFADFMHVATNVGAQAYITVNYGTGTPAAAAAWVRYANVTNHCAFKYWEIGNEVYGTWEVDTNVYPNDAYTYAVRAQQYMSQMRAADPTIKVGVVVTPGEDSSSNGYTNHPAVNPVTGQTHYGWTPVLLTTLKALGVTPDFAIHHRYPEWSPANAIACADSDPLLLQDSASGWPSDAGSLRQMISDYFGASGTNIELVCTENNSDAGAQGRQSTSLVNALYYADSLGQLAQTEFNAHIWWDFRNGPDTSGSFDPTLYGWRSNGDLGVVANLTNRYPPFYAAKLMQGFARPGDTIVQAASDYLLVGAYAARHADGSVSLLVLNKCTVTNFDAQIALSGFAPNAAATIRAYGIPQDQAARSNAVYAAQDIATNTFSGASATFDYNLPALSLTLFTFPPAAPRLAVLPPTPSGGHFILQLQGQPNVSYVIQVSTNLAAWTDVSTNTLSGSTLNVTNAMLTGPERQFWQAVWRP